MPHVTNVLTDLGRPYCLASSSDSERIRISLAVTRLAHFFEGRIFTAAMVERAKPAPDLFLLAAARMGAPPAQTLVVEDSINGVLAAKAAGMSVWGFTGGSHYAGRDMAPALKAAGADRVFHSMAEFRCRPWWAKRSVPASLRRTPAMKAAWARFALPTLRHATAPQPIDTMPQLCEHLISAIAYAHGAAKGGSI